MSVWKKEEEEKQILFKKLPLEEVSIILSQQI